MMNRTDQHDEQDRGRVSVYLTRVSLAHSCQSSSLVSVYLTRATTTGPDMRGNLEITSWMLQHRHVGKSEPNYTNSKTRQWKSTDSPVQAVLFPKPPLACPPRRYPRAHWRVIPPNSTDFVGPPLEI